MIYTKKPEFSKFIGDNIVNNLGYFIGESIYISNIYNYKDINYQYNDNIHSSQYKEVFAEIKPDLNIDNNKLKFSLPSNIKTEGNIFSFYIMLSNNKLFTNSSDLNKYAQLFYKENIENNNVTFSDFMLKEGTYTKYSWAVYPHVKSGYVLSIHHSSKRSILPLYNKTKSIYLRNLIDSNLFSVLNYQPKVNNLNIFFTNYSSNWLRQTTNIDAPYIDTRLNEVFSLTLEDWKQINKDFNSVNTNDYVLFLKDYYLQNKELFIDKTFIYPDYFDTNATALNKIHTSLNHQLGIMQLLLTQNKDQLSIEIFNAIFNFIQDKAELFIKDNKDLYYGFVYNIAEDNINFMEQEDYPYVTLVDLLRLYLLIDNHGINVDKNILKFLIKNKLDWLSTTKYDFRLENPLVPERSSVTAQKELKELYRSYLK